MKIYLAGSVPKGDSEAKKFHDWRAQYRAVLKNVFDAEYIDPYQHHLDESDYLAVVGSDCKHIMESDLVIVNAEEKLGVGSSQEILIAKYFRKPVITVLPKGSHHRRKNIVFFNKEIEDWIHPFIHTFSDFIVEDVHDIADIKEFIFKNPKDLSVIDRALKHVKG